MIWWHVLLNEPCRLTQKALKCLISLKMVKRCAISSQFPLIQPFCFVVHKLKGSVSSLSNELIFVKYLNFAQHSKDENDSSCVFHYRRAVATRSCRRSWSGGRSGSTPSAVNEAAWPHPDVVTPQSTLELQQLLKSICSGTYCNVVDVSNCIFILYQWMCSCLIILLFFSLSR